jgi:hypothetical protein
LPSSRLLGVYDFVFAADASTSGSSGSSSEVSVGFRRNSDGTR